MSDKEHHVPSWDGSSRTWRKYTREVSWYVRATPHHKRRYCATKLMGRLTGPARLLAMSWSNVDLGTREFLQRLAESPLVRQALPNAAAICSQYFAFRRYPHEQMNSFLVREALVHSEFVEALVRLHEEKIGIKQHEKNFDLPDDDYGSYEDWWDEWYEQDWYDEDPNPVGTPSEPASRAATQAEPTQVEGSGGTPIRRRGLSTPSRRSVGVPSTDVPPGFEPLSINEMTLGDSFVLGVLRGFRLLQAAGLTADEKRDIISTTKGSLEFEVITRALQTLWDDQLLGRPNMAASSSLQAHYVEESPYHDEHEGDEWHDNYHTEYDNEWLYDDSWEYDQYYASQPAGMDTHDGHVVTSDESDPAIKEAQAAEKVAESLAMEAQRTWSEAQKATAALRRDRGFGHVKGGGRSEGCFICGSSSHYAKECPDRNHPSMLKGRSKGKYSPNGYFTEYDPYHHYFIGKGKGKSKGKKGKINHWMDIQAQWKGSKGKGKNKGMNRPSVNMYTNEMFQDGFDLHGLEMSDRDLFLSSPSAPPGSHTNSSSDALIDCGATASAGPEESVKGLIRAVLETDRSASIHIEKYMRPYFRFGNGKWGRALYRVTISSNVSGRVRSFSIFALPNPPDLHHPEFDRSTLVPILLGMDHLSGIDTAMIIDFSTGLALDAYDSDTEPYRLKKNHKGHYVYDVLYHLTRGRTRHEGHSSVRVSESQGSMSQNTIKFLEFHVLQTFDLQASELEMSARRMQQSRDRLKQLHRMAQELRNGPSAASVSMCIDTVTSSLNSFVPHSRSDGQPTCEDLGQCGHCGTDQGCHTKESSRESLRPGPSHNGRPSGSKDQGGAMAVLRKPYPGHSSGKPTWGVGGLCGVRPSVDVHTKGRITGELSPQREPRVGFKDVGGVGTFDEGSHSESNHLSGHVQEDRSGGSPITSHCSCCEAQEHSNQGIFKEQVDKCSGKPNSFKPQLGHGSGGRDGLDGSLRKGDGAVTYKPTYHTITHKMAAKVMLMASTLMTSLNVGAMNLAMDGVDGLWEVACSPHSWLSEACEKQGLQPKRINLHQGYDLYQPKTWELLQTERRQRRPRRIWFSLPCTKWCPWNRLNYANRKEELAAYQRRERKMLRNARNFIIEALLDDPTIQIYWEWPVNCDGWKQEPVIDISTFLDEHFIPWKPCRIDGCVYGMKTKDNQDFIRKQWKVMTTDERFWSTFRSKVCHANHSHRDIAGQETSRTSYYPWRMCEAIARHWSKQVVGERQLRCILAKDDLQFSQLEDPCFSGDLMAVENKDTEEEELIPDLDNPVSALPSPSPDEINRWKAKLHHYHKAAGHPTNKNLIRILRDAKQEPWKIRIAEELKCPACEALKPGGTSSGRVPPAATHDMYGPWEAVGLDVGEWIVPQQKKKIKFLLMIDLATRLRVVFPLFEPYETLTMKAETAEQVIKAFTDGWLGHYPKPIHVIADNGKSFISEKFSSFLRELGVDLTFPPEKEAWAHGIVEHAMKDVKSTASAIQLDNMVQDPVISLTLAASSLNSTEHVSGYTSHQWAFGKDHSLSDEDRLSIEQLGHRASYSNLVAARHRAEEVARKTRSLRILSRLGNSKARQPIRSFDVTELVKVWRKVVPPEQFSGPRGGLRKSGRPGWVGPGRVIFSEILPHQKEGDDRRHIVWILMNGKLLRCSVHSVRPLTSTEKFQWDLTNKEDPTKWKSLADLLPNKEYQDIVSETPDDEQADLPFLPKQPDASTYAPIRRHRDKTTLSPEDYRLVHRSSPIGHSSASTSSKPPGYGGPLGLGGQESRSTESVEAVEEPSPYLGSNPLDDCDYSPTSADPEELGPRPSVNTYERDPQEEPESKRLKDSHYDLKWVQQLQDDAMLEAQHLDLHSAFLECEECLTIEMDLQFDSHRQIKAFERNPVVFLVKKMNSSEVNLSKLNKPLVELFQRAKAKEVSSFISNNAVRKCLNNEEVKQAYGTGRILKARWVLTWKATPPEDLGEAMEDVIGNEKTTYTNDGRRKAKARIVLLGFQHPSLLDPSFKTAAPVQSMLGRNLLYLLSAHHQWTLEGLDLATAFLQTMPTAADEQLWTTGVEELRHALGVGQEGIMRILRNIYGSTTAPRGLWLDLHKKLVSLGGVPILGERCMWAWYSKTSLDTTKRFPRLIGIMGGHVDDFHRLGDRNSSEWIDICTAIDKAYRWGTAKKGSYRHAGTDVKTVSSKNGKFHVTVDQESYVESIPDLNIDPSRLQSSGTLTASEVAACRTTLGGLQWLAIQTQPLLCSRCNLLLTEVVTNGTIDTAREIQSMLGEVRRNPTQLKFMQFEDAVHWNDIVFISMGDQAHANRPKGDSTGGLVTLAAGPSSITGVVTPMSLISWRTWKLKRKAIGSNDAEVQSILEAEDQNFRVRLLWSEIHGVGRNRKDKRANLVEQAEAQVLHVRGVLCTDSRGGYDAVEINESPLLGLSNLRAALQAFQLRDNLQRVNCELRWLASDYDLADSMTKKRSESRFGLEKFLKTWVWTIAFDPSFTASKKNRRVGKSAIQQIDDSLGNDTSSNHWNSMSQAINAGFLQEWLDLSAIIASAQHPHWELPELSRFDVSQCQTDEHLTSFCAGATSVDPAAQVSSMRSQSDSNLSNPVN